MYHIFQKFNLDLCPGTCPAKFEFGQGHLAIFFQILVQNGTNISKKNNLKQKSYEDLSVLKINKSTKNLIIPLVHYNLLFNLNKKRKVKKSYFFRF